MEEKVSIIMPAYNCEKYIGKTIESVRNQTYKNWELLIVDDCSTDATPDVIKKYCSIDSRIVYFSNDNNSGAAVSRNKAVEAAQGRYIAFLDSDDLWLNEKIKKQISFMTDNDCAFTCTAYEKNYEENKSLNKKIRAKKKTDYHALLRRCPGNSTVMYDASRIGKFTIPNIRKRNDYVMWLQVIKKACYLYGIDEVLTQCEMHIDSLSSKKSSLVKYHWVVYRKIEKLSVLYSIYLIAYWIIATVLKLRK